MYFIKKYNRQISILFCVYAFLILVLCILLNSIIKPKAFTNGTSYTISYTCTTNDNIVSSTDVRYDWSGDSRFIFYSDPEFKQLITNKISGQLDSVVDLSCIRIAKTNRAEYWGGSFTSSIVSQVGPYRADSLQNYFLTFDNDIKSYFLNKGYEFNNVHNIPYFVFFTVNGANINGISYKNIGGQLVTDDVQYVDSPADLYSFMINNNNDVVKNGDPDEEVPIDSQIPTPQKVAVYKDSTSPSLVWSNPKGVANNDNIKVRIEWNPVITLTHGLYDVNSIISQDYELLYYDNVGDYNSFCTLNNNGSPPPNVLSSYNTIYDSKVLFSGTGAQQSNDWANYYILKNNIDWVSRVDPFGTNDLFGKGTYSGVRVPDLKYRIRYETETGVSDWIYSDREFDTDNVSGPSQHSSTHSRNASGDPVSNPTYTPNNDNKVIPQNEVDDQNDPDQKKSNSIFDFISGLFDTIIAAITAIFAKLKELVDSISNGTGTFFSFFADMFGAFPELLGIFLLGLVVTVLLRVLGR